MISFALGVNLQMLERSDLQLYLNWRNDYSTWKWCRQNTLINEVKHSNWFNETSEDPSSLMFAIWKDDNYAASIGVCGLTNIDRINSRAEFSLYIAPHHRGKKLAEPSLITLFAHGFLDQNLHLIWGESYQDNPANKLFSKIGMIQDGSRRDFYFRDGMFINANLYSITEDEFLKRYEEILVR